MPYAGTTQGLLGLLQEKIYNRSPQAGIDRQTLKNMYEDAIKRQKVRSVFEDVDMTDIASVNAALRQAAAKDPYTFAEPAALMTTQEAMRQAEVVRNRIAAEKIRGADMGYNWGNRAGEVNSALVEAGISSFAPQQEEKQANYNMGGGGKSPYDIMNDEKRGYIAMGYYGPAVEAAFATYPFIDTSKLGVPGGKEASKDAVDLAANDILKNPKFLELVKAEGGEIPLTNKDGEVQTTHWKGKLPSIWPINKMTPDLEGMLSKIAAPNFDISTIKDEELRAQVEFYRNLRRPKQVGEAVQAATGEQKNPF